MCGYIESIMNNDNILICDNENKRIENNDIYISF